MTHSDSDSDSSETSSEAINEPLYDHDQCIAALKGTKVPDDLSSTIARCAVIRGLRCSHDFAINPEIIDLCQSARFPEFVRARNARLIMSDCIPDGLEEKDAQPYCIWNPDLAKEDSYRQLAHRYPSMSYQVGRACAAAGYIDLYRELDLLPDISIAEEAREGNTEGGNQIYQLIISSPLRYAVMDDYERTVTTDNPRTPAFLNGDTQVRWKLEWRTTFKYDEDFGPVEIDIEEDQCLGLESSKPDQSRYDYLTPEEATLLWEPLPLDIPTLKKDLLRQMAAYEGNVDRYVRLVNPRIQSPMHDIEHMCVIRGIYHNTMFARWWQRKLDTDHARIYDEYAIQVAINARRIMINDIGTFTDDNPCLPWLFWWPLKPEKGALYALASRCPSMHVQIAIAAIFCDHQHLYESLNIRPSGGPMEAAKQVANKFYLEDLEKRAVELGIKDPYEEEPTIDLDDADLAPDMEPTGTGIYPRLRAILMDAQVHPNFYDYIRKPFSGYVERYVWLSFETIRKLDCEWAPDEYFVSNDLRYFETHELGKDENGRDFIVHTPVEERKDE